MASRAEDILETVLTLITGLTTTGANVQRGQVYAHEESKLPALSLSMGPDVPENELQTGQIYWQLTIAIQSTVKISAAYIANESAIETQLNLIRAEVHAALFADHTLGLSFVSDIAPGPAGEPVIDGAGDLPIASQLLTFGILYKTSRAALDA